jgi:hypothetical protein
MGLTARLLQLIGKLGAQLDAKKKELAAFQEKFKIRVRQNVRRLHAARRGAARLRCAALAPQ